MNKLAGRKRLSLDYIGESYGVFATHLAEDNTNSSVRIESLYDSSHGVPASLPPFPDYIAYALHTIVERLCAVFCHMNAGVYLIKGGATECERPKSLQIDQRECNNAGAMMALAPRTDERIPDCLVALTDYRAAAGLDHTGANKELLFTIFSIAHLRRIILEVAQIA